MAKKPKAAKWEKSITVDHSKATLKAIREQSETVTDTLNAWMMAKTVCSKAHSAYESEVAQLILLTGRSDTPLLDAATGEGDDLAAEPPEA